MRAWSLAVAALALCTGAQAQIVQMPHFDVERYCRRIASTGGSHSEALYGGCFDMEQSAYDGLRDRWPNLSARLRTYCDRIARTGSSGSYMMLQGCVQMEESAAQQNERREFRR